MTDILMKSIDIPNAHMVLGMILGEKKEEKRDLSDNERVTGVWISDILSPLVS